MPDDRQRYRGTLDHLLEGFQIIDKDWRYLYVNPSAAEHGRSTPDALEGRTMMEAYPGIEAAPFFDSLRTAMNERTPCRLESLFTFPDGGTRWFELRIEPVPEGVVVHSIDIDERKAAEQKLRDTAVMLEERVVERTRELAAANRELQAYGYTVSHDLGAPLRAIAGFGQALEEDCGDQLDETGKKHLARIRAAAERMKHLIDDLLSLSKLGQKGIARTSVDLSELASIVGAALDSAEPDRHVEWRIAPGLRADCDAGLARIVLENLMGNAWKFTARKENARIEVRASDGVPGGFAVVDNGAGFDMTHAKELFRPFKRLHHAQEFPGSGIGLATVRLIVEKHGGSIDVQGVVDGGATVTVSFGG
jgi:PAS domain S-box-containing protein